MPGQEELVSRTPSTGGINYLHGETERELSGVFRGPLGNYFMKIMDLNLKNYVSSLSINYSVD